MSVLTVNRAWTEPGYTPGSLFEAPFREIDCTPRFGHVADTLGNKPPALAGCSLEAFAAQLVGVVDAQLSRIDGPVHLLLSGGYDSRLLGYLLENLGYEPLCVTDGVEPSCENVMDVLGIPAERRYVHDMSQPDPYGLADAACDGFAPLYTQLRFTPPDTEGATLVTGLGGGEWFSYPASGWLNGKQRRLPGDDLVSMWLDCWPQYTLIPDAWARGYADSLHPYCTPDYAAVAATCRPEWVRETPGNPPLDLVRGAMLAHLDERLLEPAWSPHEYPWNLTSDQRARIDGRYLDSWVGRTFHRDEYGLPSGMDEANHACTLAGFATWCDRLTEAGYDLVAEAA